MASTTSRRGSRRTAPRNSARYELYATSHSSSLVQDLGTAPHDPAARRRAGSARRRANILSTTLVNSTQSDATRGGDPGSGIAVTLAS
jgi:hypothetical protein